LLGPLEGVFPMALSWWCRKFGVEPFDCFGKLLSGGIDIISGILSRERC